MSPETLAILARAQNVSQRRVEVTAAPNYAALNRRYARQKAELTRAGKDPDKVVKACLAAVREWDTWRAWPDDWSRWQRALNDSLPWGQSVLLEDLAAVPR